LAGICYALFKNLPVNFLHTNPINQALQTLCFFYANIYSWRLLKQHATFEMVEKQQLFSAMSDYGDHKQKRTDREQTEHKVFHGRPLCG